MTKRQGRSPSAALSFVGQQEQEHPQFVSSYSSRARTRTRRSKKRSLGITQKRTRNRCTTAMNGLSKMLGYSQQRHSDVASKISSDGSSFVRNATTTLEESDSCDSNRYDDHDYDDNGTLGEEDEGTVTDIEISLDDGQYSLEMLMEERPWIAGRSGNADGKNRKSSSMKQGASGKTTRRVSLRDSTNLPSHKKEKDDDCVDDEEEAASWKLIDYCPLSSWNYDDNDEDGTIETASSQEDDEEENDENRGSSKNEGNQGAEIVKVVVEAAAISEEDLMALSRGGASNKSGGSNKKNRGADTVFMGSNFCGIVHESNREVHAKGMEPGTRVAAIIGSSSSNSKNAADSRYVSVKARRLFVAPKQMDAADVCAVLSMYLPAFMALFHGRPRPHCYSKTCLMDRTVLIRKGTSLEARAAIRLAIMAGATQIYVTAPRHYRAILQKHYSGLTLLPEKDVEDWLPHVQGRMDVVLDYDFPREMQHVRQTLAPKGARLICHAGNSSATATRGAAGGGYLPSLEHWGEYCMLVTMKRATLFVKDAAIRDTAKEQVQADLNYLFQLVASRQLRPDIDCFVSMDEVVKVAATLAVSKKKRILFGSVICDPWKQPH